MAGDTKETRGNDPLKQKRRSSDARLTLNDVREKMDKAIDFLEDQLAGITQFGANMSSLVDSVKVDYYGQPTPIRNVAHSVRDGLRLSITPYDPSIVSAIVKGCQKAGLNAYKFSKEIVVVNLQPPSGDTKDEMKKRVKTLGEEAKVAIRQIRKKFKQGAEDKSEDKKLQEITDKAVQIVDNIVAKKMSYIE